MVTNKKFTLPHPNNSSLNFQKKILTTPLPPLKKNLNSLKNEHPPQKKLPNLHDLEKFHKDCACSLNITIFSLYENFF